MPCLGINLRCVSVLNRLTILVLIAIIKSA